MKLLSLKKRALFSALFILCASCSNTTENTWNADAISGSSEHAVLRLTGTSRFKDLEVELQRSGSETRIYLNAYGVPFKTDENNTLPVLITIDGEEYPCQGVVLKGNQSVRIPEEMETTLYEAIHTQRPVYIQVGRYSVEIQYAGFEKACKRFN